MDDVIGQLLKAGLLKNLGDDQERANRLRAASVQLRDRHVVSIARAVATNCGDGGSRGRGKGR